MPEREILEEPQKAWPEANDNPMKDAGAVMRGVILGADGRVSKTIKSQARVFVIKEKKASFLPKAKVHAALRLYKGVDFVGAFPGLEAEGKEARSFKVCDPGDLEAQRAELEEITCGRCNRRDEGR